MQHTQQQPKKVIAFTQPSSKASKFRHNYPLAIETRDKLLAEVYNQFTDFVLREEFLASHPVINEYTESFNLSEGKSYNLQFNLFWIKVLHSASCYPETGCINQFIHYNSQLTPLSVHWIREWEQSKPSFYRVDFKLCRNIWIMKDLFTSELVKVRIENIPNTDFKSGEIILTTLIPIGDRIYFPIVDVYRFSYSKRRPIIAILEENFELWENNQFYHTFLSLLTKALLIEQGSEYQGKQEIAAY